MKISELTTSETKLRFLTLILSLVLAVSLSGCGDDDAPDPEAGGETSGGGTAGTVPVATNVEKDFNVGIMHYTDQGSGFFPMSVIRALHDSETKAPFLEHMERFGLIPGEVSDMNPEGFPVGIVTNTIQSGDHQVEMFGFTCAACHTSDLSYNGKTIRIEGGSGLFYVDALGDAVAASLSATLKDPKGLFGFLKRLEAQVISTNPDEPSLLAKFKNFDHLKGDGEFGAGLASHILQRVKSATNAIKTDAEHLALDAEALKKVATNLLAKEHSGESPLEALEDTLEHSHLTDDLADLESALADIKYRAAFLKVRAWLSEPGNRLPAGYGRADDFGTARVELFAGWNKNNMVPVDAPVSSPQLWNVDEYAWLHWNANTNSVIQRSIGESIGVGATYNPKTLATSVPIAKQMHIEEQLLKILPPQWPGEIFGKPDQKKVAAGETIFEEHCKGCHTPAGRDEKGLLEFNLLTVEAAGTDSLDATNFDRPVYKADDSTVGFAESIATLLTELQTTQKRTMSDVDKSLMDTLEAERSPVKWRDTMTVTGGPVYPAKPLEGTWSTGPFLHNGSVPTMYHLLLPADQRPKKFFVGSNVFDPEKLGFHYETDETHSKYLKAFEFDATVKGNLNTGHEFGTDLSEEDRMALLEYLKTHKDNLDDIQNKFVPPKAE